MKRISSACLYQTLHFILDPSLEESEARAKVKQEVESYKLAAGDNVQILNETNNLDGTVFIEVRKKVSGYPVGRYFD